jgi:hypothetical protein
MNSTLLVLRLVPGLLLIGHGLQKLVPPRFSPRCCMRVACGRPGRPSNRSASAILTAHARNGIWSQDGGFEFPLVLLSLGFVISALGAGSYSINAWADVSNWAGIDWSMGNAARPAIVLAIGVGVGAGVARCCSAISRGPPPHGPAFRPRASAQTANVSGQTGLGRGPSCLEELCVK